MTILAPSVKGLLKDTEVWKSYEDHPHLKMLAHLLAKQMWLTNKISGKMKIFFENMKFYHVWYHATTSFIQYQVAKIEVQKHASWVKDALHLSAITHPRTLELVAPSPRFRKATLLLVSLIRNDVSLTGMKRFIFDQHRSWVCTSSPNFGYSKLSFLVEVNLTFMENVQNKNLHSSDFADIELTEGYHYVSSGSQRTASMISSYTFN